MLLMYQQHRMKLRAGKDQARKEVVSRMKKQSSLPIRIQIEQCNYLKQHVNGSRTGRVVQSASGQCTIRVIKLPLEGSLATPLAEVKEQIRKVYDAEFGDHLHCNHQHPSRKDGEVIMELFKESDRDDCRCVVGEWSWNETLHKLATDQLTLQCAGMPTWLTATLVARFTCPASGR